MTPRANGRLRFALFAGSWLVAASVAVAAADDRPPPFKPRDDLAITYKVTAPGMPASGARTQRWLQAATGRERAENGGAVEVADPKGGQIWRWNQPSGSAPVAIEVDHATSLDPDDLAVGYEAILAQKGVIARPTGRTETVIGIRCAEYAVTGEVVADGETLAVCVAADGLVMRDTRAAAGTTEMRQVTDIRRGPLDPRLFAPPPGAKLVPKQP